MKSAALTLAALVAVALAVSITGFGTGAAAPQEENEFAAKPPTAEEMQKGMERYMETMQPGKNHKWLGQLLGDWETTTKMWMAGPEGPPTESKGTAKFEWSVEGKWLRETTDGTMMGMPVQGHGTFGYDNFKKKYVGSWYDSLSTALYTFEGSLDQSGKTLLLWGAMDEPMTGEHDKVAHYVTRLIDKDSFVFEIHDLAIGGKNTKVMEIGYRRKK